MPAWLTAALPAAISGVASAFGQQRANRTNIQLMREANQFSAQEAAKSREFQERMSNTAVQRRMADLRRAGINPMLAYMQDASSPGGAQGSAQMAQVEDTAGRGISSAMDAIAMRKQMRLLDVQTNDARNKAKISAAEAGIKSRDLDMAYANHQYYFNKDGSAKGPLKELLDAQHGQTLSNSALAAANASMMKYRIPEQQAIARIFTDLGAFGKTSQLTLPILMQMLRTYGTKGR